MKHIIVLILLAFMSVISRADTIIKMESYNGVYRVPCTINGAKMKFVFDTGASNVCISLTMAEYLKDNGYLDSNDFVGDGKSTVADGRVVDNIRVNLRDVEIGGIHLTNVQAVVIASQNAPLLMGQSAIQKLGKVTIEGSLLRIHNDIASSEEIIDKLFSEAEQAYSDKLYDRAIAKYEELYNMRQLSQFGIYHYAWALLSNNNSDKARQILSNLNSFEYFENNKIDIYRLLGYINLDLEQYALASTYFELSSKKIQTDEYEWFKNFISMADCFYYMESWTKAADYYRFAAYLYAKIYGVDMKYLQADSKNRLKKKQQSFRNDDIDYTLYHLFFCDERAGNWDTEGFLEEAAAMARAGNKYAKDMFNKAGIDPYSSAYK